MSWICFMCDEIVYDEVWPWGNSTLCNDCYQELTDVRQEELDTDNMPIWRYKDGKLEEEE